MNKLTVKILGIPYLGKAIAKYVIIKTGGEMESTFLREYTKAFFNVDVGMYSYGACFRRTFCLGGGETVGRYCSIANNVYYIGSDHPMNLASTSPYFHENYFFRKHGIEVNDQSKYHHLTIGNDVWIGTNVTILCKCHIIGDGAVIGAGSIVNSDIPPYSIAAGNPARVIKYRFSEEEIERLNKSKWWKKTPEELINKHEFFNYPLKPISEL